MSIPLVDGGVEISVGALSMHLDNHRNTKQLIVLLRIRLIAVVDLTLSEKERGRREREGDSEKEGERVEDGRWEEKKPRKYKKSVHYLTWPP